MGVSWACWAQCIILPFILAGANTHLGRDKGDLSEVDMCGATVEFGDTSVVAAQSLSDFLQQQAPGCDLHIAGTSSSQLTGAIRLVVRPETSTLLANEGNEGFAVDVESSQAGNTTVVVTALRLRGLLFGIGHLLMRSRLLVGTSPGKHNGAASSAWMVPSNWSYAMSAASLPLRGHMLSYRALSNSYDGWDVPQMDRYLRDLVMLGGTNQLELVSPDGDQSPLFPLSQPAMMKAMSELAVKYDINLSVWWPLPSSGAYNWTAVDAVMKQLAKLNALFIPGGDPGSAPPKQLFQQARLLKAHAPNASRCDVWVSHQGLSQAHLDEFFEVLPAQQGWMRGLVWGPHTRLSLADTIAALSNTSWPSCPIRLYPDLDHQLKAEYALQRWQYGLGVTQGREGVNPQVVRHSAIAMRGVQTAEVFGFGSYSDGCLDDVNKWVWSWTTMSGVSDPFATACTYGRLFFPSNATSHLAECTELVARMATSDSWCSVFGGGHHHGVGKGQPACSLDALPLDLHVALMLVHLEQSWDGAINPLANNIHVNISLSHAQQIQSWYEARGSALPWRALALLYRANYDAYEQRRWVAEHWAEQQAMGVLRSAVYNHSSGSATPSDAAAAALHRLLDVPVWPQRAFALDAVRTLGKALFLSPVTVQLSVQYDAYNIGRGASLDTVGVPLNNVLFLNYSLLAIGSNRSSTWTDLARVAFFDTLGSPSLVLGRDVLHDNLGDLTAQPHLVWGSDNERDFACYHSPLLGFQEPFNATSVPVMPQSWYSVAETLYDVVLHVNYSLSSNLTFLRASPNTSCVTVVYAGDHMAVPMRMQAESLTSNGPSGRVDVHPFIAKPNPVRPLTFPLPLAGLDRASSVSLFFSQPPGGGGDGRGCQVAELWLAACTE